MSWLAIRFASSIAKSEHGHRLTQLRRVIPRNEPVESESKPTHSSLPIAGGSQQQTDQMGHWIAMVNARLSILQAGFPAGDHHPLQTRYFAAIPPEERSPINPLHRPDRKYLSASSMQLTPAASHKDFPDLGLHGGVSPKSPGFVLCSGLPPYGTRWASSEQCCRSASVISLIRRFGLY